MRCDVHACSAGVVTVPFMQQSVEAMATALVSSCSSSECISHTVGGGGTQSKGGSPPVHGSGLVCPWCRSGCNSKVVNRAGLTAAQAAHKKGYSQLSALLAAHVGSAMLRTLLK